MCRTRAPFRLVFARHAWKSHEAPETAENVPHWTEHSMETRGVADHACAATVMGRVN